MRRASSLFAILALLLGQAGAQLHDLTHLKHDLAVVRYGEKKAPPLGHSIEVCVGYAFICGAIGHANLWPILSPSLPEAVAVHLSVLPASRAARFISFRARLPLFSRCSRRPASARSRLRVRLACAPTRCCKRRTPP